MYVNKEIHTWSSTYAWFSPINMADSTQSLAEISTQAGTGGCLFFLAFQRGRPLKETWETHGKLIGNTRNLYEIIGNHTKS